MSVPMAEETLFRYSDEEWAAVVAELPENWPGLRNLIEIAAADYFVAVTAARGKPGRSFMKQRKKWKKAADLAGHLETLMVDLRTGNRLDMIWAVPREDRAAAALFLKYLPRFIELAERMVGKLAEMEKTMPRRNAAKPLSDAFLDVLLHEWTSQGGELKTSVRPDDTATGPLIRYLIAAADPVLVGDDAKGAKAMRAFVRRRKARDGMAN